MSDDTPVPGRSPDPGPDADAEIPDPSTATHTSVPPYAETLASNGYSDVQVVSSETAKKLKERHIRIIEYLRDHEPRSQNELADGVGIPAGDVSNLLDDLARVGIVEAVKKGRRNVPRLAHKHVIVALA